MDLNNLEKSLKNLVERIKSGSQVEDSKIEIKREWYNLGEKDKKTTSEFLKDITSLANTPGVNGFLIIGIDEKTGETIDSKFSLSGLKDLSDIYTMIVKYVDPPIDFDFTEIDLGEKTISLFILPPSLTKPHIIGEYVSKRDKIIQNYIPIRKLSGIHPANKSDLEFMFYDRKNIEPDYALDILAYRPLLKFAHWSGQPVSGNIRVVLQNYGRKPIALVGGTLEIIPNDNSDFDSEISFDLYSYIDSDKSKMKSAIRHQNYVIPTNHIQTVELNFIYREDLSEPEKQKFRDTLNHSSDCEFIIRCQDINGRTYSSKPFIKEKP